MPYQLQYTWIPVSSRPGEDHAKIRIARRHSARNSAYFSHFIGAIVDSVSGRLNFFRSQGVHLPKQWLSADPVTIENFQFFGFRDIAPLNLARIIWTYHPRPGGCEPRLGPSFRCHFIFRKYDNLPVQSSTIGEYNRESDTVQMFVTHRGTSLQMRCCRLDSGLRLPLC